MSRPLTYATVCSDVECCSAACPDAPRYKAVGNGWAVNCARWVLLRILWKEGVEW